MLKINTTEDLIPALPEFLQAPKGLLDNPLVKFELVGSPLESTLTIALHLGARQLGSDYMITYGNYDFDEIVEHGRELRAQFGNHLTSEDVHGHLVDITHALEDLGPGLGQGLSIAFDKVNDSLVGYIELPSEVRVLLKILRVGLPKAVTASVILANIIPLIYHIEGNEEAGTEQTIHSSLLQEWLDYNLNPWGKDGLNIRVAYSSKEGNFKNMIPLPSTPLPQPFYHDVPGLGELDVRENTDFIRGQYITQIINLVDHWYTKYWVDNKLAYQDILGYDPNDIADCFAGIEL